MSTNLNSKKFCRRLLSSALPCLLVGCSAGPVGSTTALAQDSTESPAEQLLPESASAQDSLGNTTGQSTMDGQLMFELMIAELAGRRGQLDVALAGYLRASQSTADPRVSERAARLALYGQQWAEAEKSSRRWLVLAPEAVDANEILAQALLQQGKTEQAIDIFSKLLKKAKNPDETVQLILAELQSANDPQQAMQVMRAVLQDVPDNTQARLAMARVQLANGDAVSALATVDEVLTQEPTHSSAALLRAQVLLLDDRSDEAFAGLEKLLSKTPDNLYLRLGFARLLLEQGEYEPVGEQLDGLYAGSQDNPDTLLTISTIALEARLTERARTYLTALLQTGTYSDQAHFYLARISDQEQNFESAIESYDAVVEGELYIPAQLRVAELLGETGDFEQGVERLNQLKSLVVDAPELQTQILITESRILQQADRFQDAVSLLTKALDDYPTNGDLLYARALAADAAGDDAMLVADLNTLIEAEPDNAHALNALGYHFADNNIELDRAEILLTKANSLMPNDPAILDSLGWLRSRQGNYTEAVSLLKSAYQIFPDPEIAAHLGESLWLNGDAEAARTLIEEALKQSPEDDRLLRVKQQIIE